MMINKFQRPSKKYYFLIALASLVLLGTSKTVFGESMTLYTGDYWYEEDGGMLNGNHWGMKNWWEPSSLWAPYPNPHYSENDLHQPPYGGSLLGLSSDNERERGPRPTPWPQSPLTPESNTNNSRNQGPVNSPWSQDSLFGGLTSGTTSSWGSVIK
ncbi:Uncharacterised protein [Streptococcus pyogenes]|uniref:hypothetical protein n=2 Tax=Streptococcus pyogenes TaxID=1314 RepID=UPI0003C7D405|nr:hypothetical protein [Streptococcus pyogenes]ESU87324.1 hypothetical protein HMPREF1242_1190 [Streptococcus pyogenes GA40884]SQE79486.1 Uncharacterised protein [Streptococcus pyogenes]SQF63538.1 Uncharacterised protein [Streptococcus pyogenes]VGS29347.1 Uncharacterised protein [Streptococcus pyogenes]VGS64207.1 Uncharacterised protein [Streptococcus pyogenes]